MVLDATNKDEVTDLLQITPGIYEDPADPEANTEYFLRVPNGFTRERTDYHSGVSLQMFRFEREIRETQWRGGEHFFDGMFIYFWLGV